MLQRQREREKQDTKQGQVNLATSMSQLSLISQDNPSILSSSIEFFMELSSNCGYALHVNSDNIQCDWIIDSGATNPMTYDPHDLACDTTPL